MNSEYAVSHEENSDIILELIYTDEEGTTFFRENAEWVELDPEEVPPTFFDLPLVFVSADFTKVYDENDDLTISDTTQYQVL